MSEAFFDRFEELTPSNQQDVPVREIRDLLLETPKHSKETTTAIRILEEFEHAAALKLPSADGLHLWFGYCVGGFHESPRRDDYFLVALKREGKSIAGYANGVEDSKRSPPSLLSQLDVEQISEAYLKELRVWLEGKMPESVGSDWYAPIETTDNISIACTPAVSARFFLRQSEDKLLLVQPSRCGGWYAELWPKKLR